jgi:hypothetical protein
MSALSVTLFALKRDDIKINIEARFEHETLIIDGYDIGKTVENYWGDSDYEYTLTIPPESVLKLCDILVIAQGDKQVLLNTLAARYCTNTCFSDIRKLLDDHKIPCEGFSWS